MADVNSRTAAPEQGSYKSKVLQSSRTDELSAPDQAATKVKLQSSKGVGTPRMTLGVAEAPAGPVGTFVPVEGTDAPDIKKSGGIGPNKSWAPGGSTQSAVDARHKFSGDAQGSEADDHYQLPQGSTVVAQPTHVDDQDVTGGDDAAAGPNKSWAPGGSTQSAVDARHKFSGDNQSSEADDDYQLPKGSTIVAQPQHVDEPRVDDSLTGLSVKTGQTADKQELADDVVSPHSRGRLWSPKGNTQSPIDGRFSFRRSSSGGQASVKLDYQLPEGAEVVHQPQHVDDLGSASEHEGAAPAAGQAATGGPIATGVASHKLPDDTITESLTPEMKSQNPLAAAAATVASTAAAAAAKPVAAVVGRLKSVVAGSGGEKSEGDGDEGEEESGGLKIAMSEYVEIEGGDKVLAAAVL